MIRARRTARGSWWRFFDAASGICIRRCRRHGIAAAEEPVKTSVMDWSETLAPELERFWRTDDGLTAVERAEAYGIDVSLLEENLRLSPAERLRQNDRSLNEAEVLREAYLVSRERTDAYHAASR